MSVVSANSAISKKQAEAWARLIPGEEPGFSGERKKPPKSVKHKLHEIPLTRGVPKQADGPTTFLLPKPLQSRSARQWMQYMSMDCALIAINWLAIGALLVPLRILFPHRRVVQFDQGVPLSLMGLALFHAALITLIGYTEGLHAEAEDLRAERRILAKSVTLATLVLCIGYQLQGAPWSIAILFCIAGCFHFAALSLWRWAQRSSAMGQTRNTRTVLIVGAGAVGRRVASYLEGHPSGRKVYGFLDDVRPLGNGVIGRVRDLAQIARKGFVEEIILAGVCDRELTTSVFHDACRLKLDVEVVPELFGYDAALDEVERVDGLPVICIHAERLPSAGLVLKRLADLVGAVSALVLLSPLLGIVSALIKLDSEGPVLYSAQRAGRKGQLFRCHKFRTMVSNADRLKSSLRENNERFGPVF